MASPPSTLSLPQKRPSISLPGSSHKRRKPSSGPSALRQTSFPPESSGRPEDRLQHSRSPSVDTNSVTNGSTRGRKRRRGATEADTADGRSVAGTSALDKGGSAMSAADGEEEGDDEGDEDDGDEEGGKMDEAAEKQAAERLNLLMHHLTQDQHRRYDIYRRVKLKKEIVRRITNQTLSQSVPASVITTINGYTKLFIGSLIDRARTVQAERAHDRVSLPVALKVAPEHASQDLVRALKPLVPASVSTSQEETPTLVQNGAFAVSSTLGPPINNSPYARTSPYGPTSPYAQDSLAARTGSGYGMQQQERSKDLKLKPEEITQLEELTRQELLGDDLGPLEPDHLREALRRYKKGLQGGDAGFVGLSLEGKENTAIRARGKRLFR